MTKSDNTTQTDKRLQILATAQEIILGKGFAAVGLNEILKAAGVPKGSFYHYFGSKEQFGCELLENYFDDYLVNLDQILTTNDKPALSRLLNYFDNWKQTQCSDTHTDKCMVVKLSGEVSDLSEKMRLSLKQGTQRILNRIADCVQEAIDKDEVTVQDDAATVAKGLYYLWLGATLMTKINHDPSGLEIAMQITRSRLHIK